MIGAVEISVTVFNALTNMLDCPRVNMHHHNSKSSKAVLHENINLLTDLKQKCKQALVHFSWEQEERNEGEVEEGKVLVVEQADHEELEVEEAEENNLKSHIYDHNTTAALAAASANVDPACSKLWLSEIQSLWEKYQNTVTGSNAKNRYEQVNVSSSNWASVLLHMCIQMCWYHGVAVKNKHLVAGAKKLTMSMKLNADGNNPKEHMIKLVLKLFADNYLTNALTRAERKQQYPSKILVTANLYCSNDCSTTGFGEITTEVDKMQMAELSSYLMQTALKTSVDLVQDDINKKKLGDKLKIIFTDNLLMKQGHYSTFRHFNVTELTRDERSIVEHVEMNMELQLIVRSEQVNIPKSFIVKTYYVETQCYMNEMSIYEKKPALGFPTAYYWDRHNKSIIMEYVGESCKDHKFTISELIQMCEIVDTLHCQFKYVHNDLKESNFTKMKQQDSSKEASSSRSNEAEEFTIFLVDFESVGEDCAPSSISTSGYKAPERLIGEKRSYYESDIYSLGIIFAKQVRTVAQAALLMHFIY